MKRPQARENADAFSFASDWLRGWREFSRPITERSEAKPMQSRITFDTKLKIALEILADAENKNVRVEKGKPT